MPLNKLPLPPKPAKRGSKIGWKVVGGEVPPETADRFHQIALKRKTTRSALAGELISQFVEREFDKAA